MQKDALINPLAFNYSIESVPRNILRLWSIHKSISTKSWLNSLELMNWGVIGYSWWHFMQQKSSYLVAKAATMVFLDENGFNFNNWVRRIGRSREFFHGKLPRLSGLRWRRLPGLITNPWIMGNMMIHGDSPMVIHLFFFFLWRENTIPLSDQAMFCWNFPCRYGLGWLRPSDEEDQDPGWSGWTAGSGRDFGVIYIYIYIYMYVYITYQQRCDILSLIFLVR